MDPAGPHPFNSRPAGTGTWPGGTGRAPPTPPSIPELFALKIWATIRRRPGNVGRQGLARPLGLTVTPRGGAHPFKEDGQPRDATAGLHWPRPDIGNETAGDGRKHVFNSAIFFLEGNACR